MGARSAPPVFDQRRMTKAAVVYPALESAG